MTLRSLIFFPLPLLVACTTFGGNVPAQKPPSMAQVLSNSTPADWRPLDPENTLYVELRTGRVVIELAPWFASNTVANVKALARDHYYDGIPISRVQDNSVVSWEYPDEQKPKLARRMKHGKSTLPPEFDRPIAGAPPFTPLPDGDVYAPEVGFCGDFPAARDPKTGRMWLIHEYGMVGVGRDNPVDSGGGLEMYVVIGQSPRQWDRNVTLIGRVVQGIERLSTLPRGSGPIGEYEKASQYVPVKSIRVAADLPYSKRTNFEVMRTDTATFQNLIESRRNRPEEWFHGVSAGKIELASIPIPIRAAKGRPAP